MMMMMMMKMLCDENCCDQDRRKTIVVMMMTTMTMTQQRKKLQQSIVVVWVEAKESTPGARQRWLCPNNAAMETSTPCDRNVPCIAHEKMKNRVRIGNMAKG